MADFFSCFRQVNENFTSPMNFYIYLADTADKQVKSSGTFDSLLLHVFGNTREEDKAVIFNNRCNKTIKTNYYYELSC